MGIDWETIGIQINIYIICQEAKNVKKFEIGQNDRNNDYWQVCTIFLWSARDDLSEEVGFELFSFSLKIQ